MKKYLPYAIPPLVILLAIVVAVIIVKSRPHAGHRPVQILAPQVRVITAHRQRYQFQVRSQGTVVPRTEITLVAEVAGRVVEASPQFNAGGFFKADEPLIEIDPRDYELAVVRAQTQVRQAELQLELERANADVARSEWGELGEGEGSPLALRQPQVAQAEAGLAAAQAALEQTRRDLERARVSVPFDGRIRRKNVDIGQYVTRGQPVAAVYAVDYVEVRLPLAGSDAGFLDLPLGYRDDASPDGGPEVALRASFAGGTHVWTGHITRTEGEIDPQSRLLYAVARVDDPYGRHEGDPDRPPLAIGLFVDAEISGRAVEGVFVLPRRAFLGRDRLLVVDAEDRLRFRRVEILRAEREVVVVRAGLEDGERVNLSPIDAPVDGMLVRPTPAGSLEAQPEIGGA